LLDESLLPFESDETSSVGSVVDKSIESGELGEEVEKGEDFGGIRIQGFVDVVDLEFGFVDKSEEGVEFMDIEDSQDDLLHPLDFVFGIGHLFDVSDVFDVQHSDADQFFLQFKQFQVQAWISEYLFVFGKVHHPHVLSPDIEQGLHDLSEVFVSRRYFLDEKVKLFYVLSLQIGLDLLVVDPFLIDMADETQSRCDFVALPQSFEDVHLVRVVVILLLDLELPISLPPPQQLILTASIYLSLGLS
jgi:hypothetical protein